MMSAAGLSRTPRGRRGFARSGRFRPKRFYEWEGAAFSGTAATGSAVAFVIVPVAFIQEMQSPTVVRIRGNLTLTLGGDIAGDEVVAACGIELLPTNVTSQFEFPHTDANSSRWLWHQYVPMFSLASTTTGPYEMSKTVRVMIDTKAMRKASDNDDLLLVVQNVVAVATVDIRVVGGIRTLFQAA